MNAKHLFRFSIVAAALVAAAPYAVAQERAATRADVRAAVLQARAEGTLIPPGQGVRPSFQPQTYAERTREDVRREVLQARADGELVPAGQGSPFTPAAMPTMLARAEVKDTVRLARQRGELVPAGEGMGPVEWHAKGYPARSASFAANRPR
ncbi:MAG: hypothetical protein ACXWUL_01890 [Caldimonas sp.]